MPSGPIELQCTPPTIDPTSRVEQDWLRTFGLTAQPMNKHEHDHSHKHDRAHSKPGWKPHRDWRVWVVVAMLAAMAIYVLTLDESLLPGGGSGEPVPAAPAAAAP